VAVSEARRNIRVELARRSSSKIAGAGLFRICKRKSLAAMVAEFTFACVAGGGAAVHIGRHRDLEIV